LNSITANMINGLEDILDSAKYQFRKSKRYLEKTPSLVVALKALAILAVGFAAGFLISNGGVVYTSAVALFAGIAVTCWTGEAANQGASSFGASIAAPSGLVAFGLIFSAGPALALPVVASVGTAALLSKWADTFK